MILTKWWSNRKNLQKLFDLIKTDFPSPGDVVELSSQIDSPSLDRKISQLMKKGDFSSVVKIVAPLEKNHAVVCDTIGQYDFDKLLSKLSNRAFYDLLASQTYCATPEILTFRELSSQQTTQLVQALWQATYTHLLPDRQDETFAKMLKLFSPNNRDTVQDMVVDIIPKEVFFNHHLHYQGQLSQSLFSKPYSKEQIFRAWQNIKIRQNWFELKEEHPYLDDFMKHNFFSSQFLHPEQRTQVMSDRLCTYMEHDFLQVNLEASSKTRPRVKL